MAKGSRHPEARGLLRFACAQRGAPINVPQNSVAKNDPFARLGLQISMRQRPRARIWRLNFAVCAIRQATQKSENVTRGATGRPAERSSARVRWLSFQRAVGQAFSLTGASSGDGTAGRRCQAKGLPYRSLASWVANFCSEVRQFSAAFAG